MNRFFFPVALAALVQAAPVPEEFNGWLEVEAEDYAFQSADDIRRWYRVSPDTHGLPQPDGDPPHLAQASGGAYLEILPDTRRTHDDVLEHGISFSNQPGKLAILHYPVKFNTPGRYYVWVNAFSTGPEDNGIHVGLNGEWPKSGQRMQWCQGKNGWRWESRQRTSDVHCGVRHRIWIDVPSAGEHEVQFSMREDGFEFDRFILTRDKELPARYMNDFFAMSFGFRDLPVDRQIDFLQSAGYRGIGLHAWNEETLQRVREAAAHPAVQSGAFRIYGIYLPLDIDRDDHRALVSEVLDIGEATSAPAWLTARNADANEQDVVEWYRSICDEALEHGVSVVIYPHDRHYVTNVEASLDLIAKVDRKNLFTSIHLNQELRAGNTGRLADVVRIAAGKARLASIGGAALPGQYNPGSKDWSDVNRPLDRSAFDVESYYRMLQDAGYRGPIAYNNFGIEEDVFDHHQRTLEIFNAW